MCKNLINNIKIADFIIIIGIITALFVGFFT